VWLTIPLGFLSGLFLEIILVPSFFIGAVGAVFSFIESIKILGYLATIN